MAFHGTFEHTLDAKNRLTLPAKFRTALAGKVFLVRSQDPCIAIYPGEAYEALAAQALQGVNPLSKEGKRHRRRFYALTDDVELDGAGRVTLQGKHLEHAGISTREVVIAGAGDSLELWHPDTWSSYEDELTADEEDA
jgi:MraZ protein